MNYAKRVVEALVVSGKMDEDAAVSLMASNRGMVVFGGMNGDAAEDVAHDLFLTITGSDYVIEVGPKKMLKPVRSSAALRVAPKNVDRYVSYVMESV